MIRKRIIFRGRVQGVGFRYNARRAANSYGCTGWVRNEYDGSVTMEIQGPEARVDMVLLNITSSFGSPGSLAHFSLARIDNMESSTVPVEADEVGFRAM